jgi:hypothetical protein
MNIANKFALALGMLGTLSAGFSQEAAAMSTTSPFKQMSPIVAGDYGYIQWHDSTSDAIRQDALPNTGRMFILYYKSGDPVSGLQQWNIEDVARNWGGYLTNSVRFYKVDIDNDVTTNSRVVSVPTMLMVVPDPSGKLKVLNCHVGYLDHEQTYDFFQKGMKYPAESVQPQPHANAITPDMVPGLIESRSLPVLALYYDSSSILSAVEEVLFDKLSAAHAAQMSFVKIDVIQDEDDTNKLGGIPCLVLYQLAPDGTLLESQPVNGFRDADGLEALIQSAIPKQEKPVEQKQAAPAKQHK